MATPAERKALFFFGLVAMLGAGVRAWRASRPAKALATPDTYTDQTANRGKSHSAKLTTSSPARTQRRTATSRTGQINRDSNAIVDLDRATTSEIDALGLLPTGIARLIVADRDSFGPFGSMDELRRVPFISASTLRKLAPRVTFSRVPRPRNTVVHPRTLPPITLRRRKAGAQP